MALGDDIVLGAGQVLGSLRFGADHRDAATALAKNRMETENEALRDDSLRLADQGYRVSGWSLRPSTLQSIATHHGDEALTANDDHPDEADGEAAVRVDRPGEG